MVRRNEFLTPYEAIIQGINNLSLRPIKTIYSHQRCIIQHTLSRQFSCTYYLNNALARKPFDAITANKKETASVVYRLQGQRYYVHVFFNFNKLIKV